MPRCLILTYSYPPLTNARAFRWGAVAEALAAQGFDVDVVCAWEPGLPETEIRSGVNVCRVNTRWLEKVRGQFIQSKAASVRVAAQPGASPSASIGTRARKLIKPAAKWLYERVYLQTLWPDAGAAWIRPAQRQARELITAKKYDALISVSLYFAAHLVAERIHPHMPGAIWLADVGDPFSLNDVPNNNPIFSARNRRAEQRILAAADAISVTTPGTRDLYAAHFPDAAGKIHVIPPLLSLTQTAITGDRLFADDDRVRLVFTGSLYAGIRRPDFILRLLDGLTRRPIGEQVELHVFGYAAPLMPVFEQFPHLLNRRVFVHGRVDRAAAARAMHEADVLVNIGNATTYQLPSKVVEYASTGKRVLNLASITDDSSSAFFADYPAALTLVEGGNLSAQVDTLEQFITRAPQPIDPVRLEAFLAPYRLDAITAAYARLIIPAKVTI
jgi:glycosyltransferase involved in cell wall biosynthesis